MDYVEAFRPEDIVELHYAVELYDWEGTKLDATAYDAYAVPQVSE